MVINQQTGSKNYHMRVLHVIPPEIYVGLERTVQSVQESTKSVQVCVILSDYANVSSVSRRSCPVEFSVTVGVNANEGSAGSNVIR